MSKTLHKSTFPKPGDLLLVSIFLILSISGLFLRPAVKGGSKVSISVNNQVVQALSLMTDSTVTVNGNLGPVIIRISSGSVRVEASECPHQYCIREGRIHRDGEMLVCLPNRVVVRVESEDASGMDGISQ